MATLRPIPEASNIFFRICPLTLHINLIVCHTHFRVYPVKNPTLCVVCLSKTKNNFTTAITLSVQLATAVESNLSCTGGTYDVQIYYKNSKIKHYLICQHFHILVSRLSCWDAATVVTFTLNRIITIYNFFMSNTFKKIILNIRTR